MSQWFRQQQRHCTTEVAKGVPTKPLPLCTFNRKPRAKKVSIAPPASGKGGSLALPTIARRKAAPRRSHLNFCRSPISVSIPPNGDFGHCPQPRSLSNHSLKDCSWPAPNSKWQLLPPTALMKRPSPKRHSMHARSSVTFFNSAPLNYQWSPTAY